MLLGSTPSSDASPAAAGCNVSTAAVRRASRSAGPRAARRVASAQRRRVWRALISAMAGSAAASPRFASSRAPSVRIVMTSPQVTALLRRRSAAALTIQSGARNGGADAAAVARAGKAAAAYDPEAPTQPARLSHLPLHTRQPPQHDPAATRRARPPRARNTGARAPPPSSSPRGFAGGPRGGGREASAATTVQRRARQRGAEANGGAVGGASVRSDGRTATTRDWWSAVSSRRRRREGSCRAALGNIWNCCSRAPSAAAETIVHAVAEGGSVVLLQEVVKKVAEATLGRIASLHEATVLACRTHGFSTSAARRRSTPPPPPASSTPYSGSSQRRRISRLTADRTPTSPSRRNLGLADADGRTPLHAALYAAGAADASVERRARLACWLLQHVAAGGEPIEPPASSAAAAAALPHLGDDGLAEISSISMGTAVPSSLRSAWAEAR